MNTTRNTLAALIAGLITLGAAGAAQAECVALELCDTRLDVSHSERTRAEVRAEVIAARKDGTLAAGEVETVSFQPTATPPLTRAEVRAGAAEAARKPINFNYPG